MNTGKAREGAGRFSGEKVEKGNAEQIHMDGQEHPPSYEHELSSASRLTTRSTRSSQRASQVDTADASPTTESQFTFPTEGPPPYAPIRSIEGLLAIPQIHNSLTAPFLAAYPPVLSASGITQETWTSFTATVSAFLAANTSKRMRNHAADIATSVPKQLGKDLLATSTQSAKNLGQSAKNLNPFGIVASAVGFSLGVTGAVVKSVVTAPGALATPPRTPVARAEAYLAAANKKWLHARKLHALLLALPELAKEVGLLPEEILREVTAVREGGVVRQMAALQPWIGEMVMGTQNNAQVAVQQSTGTTGSRMRQRENRIDVKDQRSFARGASKVGLSVADTVITVGERGELERTGSSSAGDASSSLILELGLDTMWLVITRWEGERAL